MTICVVALISAYRAEMADVRWPAMGTSIHGDPQSSGTNRCRLADHRHCQTRPIKEKAHQSRDMVLICLLYVTISHTVQHANCFVFFSFHNKTHQHKYYHYWTARGDRWHLPRQGCRKCNVSSFHLHLACVFPIP